MRIRTSRVLARAAFTLTEMLVVVAIIVVLAGIGATILLPQLEKAKENTAVIKATEIKHAAETYATQHDGEIPQNVAVLAQPDQGLNNSGYISVEATKDPWGQEFKIQEVNPGQIKVWAEHNGKRFESR
jgi:prepilin-type N-terminal cleavage/methylation domain-containing protein